MLVRTHHTGSQHFNSSGDVAMSHLNWSLPSGCYVKGDGGDRNRNDSGCFEDFEDPGLLMDSWDEAVDQWGQRVRCVMSQEMQRMRHLTDKRKADLSRFGDPDAAHALWKEDIRGTMELAVDLIKCVSYDIIEEYAAAGGGGKKKTTKLEQLEVASEQDRHTDSKSQLVLVVRSSRSAVRKGRSPYAKLFARDRRRVKWLAISELKQLRQMTTDAIRVGPATPQGGLTDRPSDDASKCPDDINGIFWQLSQNQSKQEQSAGNAKMGRAKSRRQPCKSYWNIFRHWKHNLKEPDSSAKAAPRRLASCSPTDGPEVYFSDWSFNFNGRSKLSRRHDEVDGDSLSELSKKARHDQGAPRRMGFRFGRAYRQMNEALKQILRESVSLDKFDVWSHEEDVQRLTYSRAEFLRLRKEVRKQRFWIRELNVVISPETWLEEWRWNLDSDITKLTVPEEADPEDGKMRLPVIPRKAVVAVIQKKAWPTAAAFFDGKLSKRCNQAVSLEHKCHLTKLNKCYSKQPAPRSRQ